jgi:hypothetical protein
MWIDLLVLLAVSTRPRLLLFMHGFLPPMHDF